MWQAGSRPRAPRPRHGNAERLGRARGAGGDGRGRGPRPRGRGSLGGHVPPAKGADSCVSVGEGGLSCFARPSRPNLSSRERPKVKETCVFGLWRLSTNHHRRFDRLAKPVKQGLLRSLLSRRGRLAAGVRAARVRDSDPDTAVSGRSWRRENHAGGRPAAVLEEPIRRSARRC